MFEKDRSNSDKASDTAVPFLVYEYSKQTVEDLKTNNKSFTEYEIVGSLFHQMKLVLDVMEKDLTYRRNMADCLK